MEKKEVKQEEPKKKGFLGKMKEGAEDHEDQLAILGTFVRLGILIWSGGILTLAYVKLPPSLNIPEQKLDPTFIASVFTWVLATFGAQVGSKKNGGANAAGANISKKDMEYLIEKASQTAPAQVVRIEQGPVKIVPDNK